MQSLTDSLKGKPKEFKLASEAVEASKQLKDKLAQTSTLLYSNSHSPLDAMVDAVGGTLNQFVKKAWKPDSFFSKRLASTETRHSTFGQKLLAISI